MNPQPLPYLVSLKVFGIGVAVLTMLGGALAVVGWAQDVMVLKSVFPGWATMKVNTAVAFFCLGAGLLFAITGRDAPVSRYGYQVLAAAAAFLGFITLVEYMFNWDAGIDNIFFLDKETPADQFPGRASLGTALNFVFLGSALFLRRKRAARFFASFLIATAFLISLVAIYAYVLAAPALYSVIFYNSMAMHTALLFSLLSLGCMLTAPYGWLVKVVFSDEIGSRLSRWLLPFALLGPAIMALIFEYGVEHDLYHSDFGRALLAVSIAVSSSLLILFFAYRTNALDAIRRSKEALEQAHAELKFFTDGLAKANARLEQLSSTDPLTELSNRRVFNSRLSEELARSHRYNLPLSVLILDVDNFKAYNDTFGHPEGDEVLKTIAHLLSQSVREVDCVARLGGEEFGVVLPETDIANAQKLAERMRASIEKAAWLKRPVTISIGVASLSKAVPDAKTIVLKADAALYEAKRNGRNRVVGAEHHGTDDLSAVKVNPRAMA